MRFAGPECKGTRDNCRSHHGRPHAKRRDASEALGIPSRRSGLHLLDGNKAEAFYRPGHVPKTATFPSHPRSRWQTYRAGAADILLRTRRIDGARPPYRILYKNDGLDPGDRPVETDNYIFRR